MPITIKGRDLISLISGGTYNRNKNIGSEVTNFPYGNTSKEWAYPKPVGITVRGLDICNQYEARYTDYNDTANSQNIPDGVTELRVICIGGGGAGGGGTSSFNEPNWNGWPGGSGGAGGTVVGIIPRGNDNMFNVTIGNGGNRSNYVTDEGNYKYRVLGSTNGNETVVQCGSKRLIAYGGTVGGNGNPDHNGGGPGSGSSGGGDGGAQVTWTGKGGDGRWGGREDWDAGGHDGNLAKNSQDGNRFPVLNGDAGYGGRGGIGGWANGYHWNDQGVDSRGFLGGKGTCRVYFLYG